MMFRPATAQMTPRVRARSPAGPTDRNAVPLITALTAEMHAVRMYVTRMEATATNDATGPRTRYENEYTPPPRMSWCSRMRAISTMRLESTRMRSDVAAMKKIALCPMYRCASAGA
jgi:hypothetical protein